MIFDTSFVIDVMAGETKAVEKLKEVIKNGEPEIVTAPTIFELFSGLAQSSKPELERKKILSALSRMTVWHLEAEAAERGGEVDGLLIKSGNQIDPIDSMIAGIAFSKGEKILTRDKHFSKVAGLKTESW
ncbi:TPA: PIN domain-containing protein [archaeon]|nr:PIN domain-containing protein [Candidatus Naiadarchaeales archaeon SRR2090153.bin461]